MDIFKCSACGGEIRRDEKLGMGVCKDCGRINHYAFISYSSQDQQAADTVFQIFLEHSIPVWMSANDMGVGQVYASALTDALENCSCMVLLLTNASQSSSMVLREVEHIVSMNKPILPVKLEELELNKEFRFFIKANYILALPQINEQDPKFQMLLRNVKSLMKETHYPRPEAALQEKAAEKDIKAPAVNEPEGGKTRDDGKTQEGPAEAGTKSGSGSPGGAGFKLKRKSTAIIAACAAAVLLGAALIGGGKKAEEPLPTPEVESIAPQPTEAPEKKIVNMDDTRLMVDSPEVKKETDAYTATVLGSDITRREIHTISFVNLKADGAPQPNDGAWDVSAGNNGRIVAWVEESLVPASSAVEEYMGEGMSLPPVEKLYDLYIGSETKIDAPESCERLFMGYSNLRSVDFAGHFQNSETLSMEGMFAMCGNLYDMDASVLYGRDCENFRGMFYKCGRFSELDLSNLSPRSCQDLSYMFYGCEELKSLDISGFNTFYIKDMSYMFSGCRSLESLDLSSLYTENTENMSYMFSDCYSLTQINVKGLDTSRVTNMEAMFNGCSALTELDVSRFDTTVVSNMSLMFSGCAALTELDVSGFDTSSVIDMGYMFSGCSALQSLNVSGFDTSRVSDMEAMFNGCISLESLDLKNFDTSRVSNMAAMFSGCSNLERLDVSGFDTSRIRSMELMFWACSRLESLDLRSFDTGLVTTMEAMFWGCESLQNLNVSSFDTSEVRTMYAMFSGCAALTGLDVTGFDTGLVENMDSMFSDCTALRSLDISGFDTSSLVEASYMLAAVPELPDQDLSGWNTEKLEDVTWFMDEGKTVNGQPWEEFFA